MRAHVSGHVSLAEAQAMDAMMDPGQPYHQALIFNLVAKGTDYSPDSRKCFTAMKGKYKRMATVVPNAIIRATINFMLRLTGAAADFRLFENEAAAMAFLDGVD
jgi:hypothetical protein